MGSIFSKVRLKPTQLRTVAERRFEDAVYLRRSGINARANAVMYLGGFVIECLLKAELLERNSWLGNPGDLSVRPPAERQLFALCYQRHDLDELVERMPDLSLRLHRMDISNRLVRNLHSVCSTWTVFARYSPKMATMTDAGEFLDMIAELKKRLLQ